MTSSSRRSCLASVCALALWPRSAKAAQTSRFRIGVTDWNLGLSAKVEAIALAKQLGFDGVQVSIGRGTDKLPLSVPARQAEYLSAAREHKLPVASLCLDILHKNILKSREDPLGPRWVADSIPIAKAMGVKVVLLPFFGRGALKSTDEMDRVGDVLRELAPEAEKAGVVLGLEDTISAKDNVRIMERSKSPAVQTYYDVGEAREAGCDPVAELRWLGRSRICEVHLKDNPHYMGTGSLDFKNIVGALNDIGFDAWAQLEADRVGPDLNADMRRNLSFIRDVVAQARTVKH